MPRRIKPSEVRQGQAWQRAGQAGKVPPMVTRLRVTVIEGDSDVMLQFDCVDETGAVVAHIGHSDWLGHDDNVTITLEEPVSIE